MNQMTEAAPPATVNTAPKISNTNTKIVTQGLDAGKNIVNALLHLFDFGDCAELCAIAPRVAASSLWEGRAYGKKPIVAGWFDDLDRLAETAQALDEQARPEGIYVCLNPVNRALLGRACNRLRANVGRTQDVEIERRSTILIDCDPVRPAYISAADEEKAAAYETMLSVFEWLCVQGWPEPLMADSGNGYHLLYRVDTPNDTASATQVQALLASLAVRFDTPQVKIDQTVFNAARLVKLYGTHARKGDDIPERPHRLARILSMPEVGQ